MYFFIFKTHRLQSATIILYSFLYSLFSAASVTILMPFVNFIFTGYDPAQLGIYIPFLDNDKEKWLIVLCIVTWLAFLLKNLSFAAAEHRVSQMRNELMMQLRDDYLLNIFGQSMVYFHSTPAGYITSRMIDLTRQFSEKVSLGFSSLSRNIPLIVLYLAILAFISWKLMALSLLLIPLISVAGNRLHKILQKSVHEEQQSLSRLVQYIQQKIYGIKIIKLFHSEELERDKFHDQNSKLRRILVVRDRIESTGISLVEMIGVSAGVFLLYVIGTETLSGRFQYGPGGFVLYIAAVFSLIDPVRNLFRSIHMFKEAGVLWKILHPLEITEKPEPATTDEPKNFERQIVFEQVSFKFDTRSSTLFENLNVTIHKGEKIVLTGNSGIGKSTFIDLMLGFYRPSAGTITLDGTPVVNMNKVHVSHLFGVVTQEAFLFHDSVRNNVAYNKNHLTDNEIVEAMNKVQLMDWYLQQPHGLDTLIGDRGQTMSGGEKQKLVLARLILRNPDILIFDEATSAMDLKTEKALLDIILNTFADKTMIFISHRHSIYPFADRILEVNGRSIAERLKPPTFA